MKAITLDEVHQLHNDYGSFEYWLSKINKQIKTCATEGKTALKVQLCQFGNLITADESRLTDIQKRVIAAYREVGFKCKLKVKISGHFEESYLSISWTVN